MRPLVYILDDDIVFAKLLKANLGNVGEFKVELFEDPLECLAAIGESPPHIVITDLYMEQLDGVEVSRRIRAMDAHLPVFVVTAQGEIETAIEAMKAGANEYLQKPINVDRLRTLILRVLERRPLLQEAVAARAASRAEFGPESLIGSHPLMERTREFVRGIGKVPQVAVLLLGESGVGKNLVARSIHYAGDEPLGRFVELNCAAVPDNLLEAELFGYMKGAFTDARENKQGLVEVADGGTLFLDEIGEMPLALQAKLLNFVESRRFRRLGATREREVDLRLVTATNQDLQARVAEGAFREDLFYRISTATYVIPPLRDIRTDIPALADHFAKEIGRNFGKRIEGVTPAALGRLEAHDWPGNVRELRNVIERALIFAEGPELVVEDLPDAFERRSRPRTQEGIPLGLTLRELEAKYIALTVQALDGRIGDAAESLGISRKSLWERRKRYGLMD
jgi:DNA-binding NtrC family response regulator